MGPAVRENWSRLRFSLLCLSSREGKMPDSKRPHVDPEEKKAVSRRHGDAGKKTAKKDIYNRCWVGNLTFLMTSAAGTP